MLRMEQRWDGVQGLSGNFDYDDNVGLRHLVVKSPQLRQLWLSGKGGRGSTAVCWEC
jgi:hypothetical protein